MAAQQGAEVGAEVVAGSFEVSNNVRCRLTESHPYLYLGAKIFPEKVKFFAPILGRFLFVCFLFFVFRFFVLLLLLFWGGPQVLVTRKLLDSELRTLEQKYFR